MTQAGPIRASLGLGERGVPLPLGVANWGGRKPTAPLRRKPAREHHGETGAPPEGRADPACITDYPEFLEPASASCG